MQNIKDFYIRGFPIDTPIGKCHFITMRERDEIYKYQKLLFFTKEDLYNFIEDVLNITKEEYLQNFKEDMVKKYELQKYQLIDLIKNTKKILEYYSIYKAIFDYFLGENTFDNLIDSDEKLLIYKIQVMGQVNQLINNEEYDYEEDMGDLSINEKKKIIEQLNKNKLINTQINKNEDKNKKTDLYINIIKGIPMLGFYQSYCDLFNLCFKEERNVFDKIKTDIELEQYLQLIIDMNLINEPEEQIDYSKADADVIRFDMYDKYLKKKNQGNITFESVYTSLWLSLKAQPEFLTLYQYSKLFSQLGQFKGYDASIHGCSKDPVLWCGNSKEKENNNADDDIDDEMFKEARDNMSKVIRDIT